MTVTYENGFKVLTDNGRVVARISLSQLRAALTSLNNQRAHIASTDPDNPMLSRIDVQIASVQNDITECEKTVS